MKIAAGKAGTFGCSSTIPCFDVDLNNVHVTSALGWTCDVGLINATSANVHPNFCGMHKIFSK